MKVDEHIMIADLTTVPIAIPMIAGPATITAAVTFPVQLRRQFNGTRKVGKVHQNVLVFCKGSVEETIDSFEAVSYTHLDVYKRQKLEYHSRRY